MGSVDELRDVIRAHLHRDDETADSSWDLALTARAAGGGRVGEGSRGPVVAVADGSPAGASVVRRKAL
jgi:hypothetical protein